MSDELTKTVQLTKDQLEGLRKLREPFPPEQISKLPKPTRKQTDELKANYKNGIRCKICGGWHHKDVVHLDYVGHAALTSRLLDADPLWNWEPFATEENGSPKLDNTGGMWGWLTVCGLTRRGYGDSDGKSGCNANKERVGDFLRNAAMRFGAAIDLWSKADLTKIDGLNDTDTQEPTVDAAYWCDKLDREAPKNLGGIKTWKAKNFKAISKMAEGQEKADTLAYIEDMIKEYTPAKQENTDKKPVDRTMVEKCLVYLGSVSSSLDEFMLGWNEHIKNNLKGLPTDQQKELTDLKAAIETKFQGE